MGPLPNPEQCQRPVTHPNNVSGLQNSRVAVLQAGLCARAAGPAESDSPVETASQGLNGRFTTSSPALFRRRKYFGGGINHPVAIDLVRPLLLLVDHYWSHRYFRLLVTIGHTAASACWSLLVTPLLPLVGHYWSHRNFRLLVTICHTATSARGSGSGY
eukprot:1186921-Prorocentrum_minimum.AAC.5